MILLFKAFKAHTCIKSCTEQEINIHSLIYKENYISIYSSIFNVVCTNHGVVYKIHGVIYTDHGVICTDHVVIYRIEAHSTKNI